MTRLAVARKIVIFAGKANEEHFSAKLFQRHEQLLALFDRATIVLFAVEDEDWGLNVLDVANRRVASVQVGVLPLALS